MKSKQKDILEGLLSALGVLIYTSLVVWVMTTVDQMNQPPAFWGPLAFLMLFVLSAIIVGLLVLGRPVYLYINQSKDQATKLLFYTVGWLLLLTIVILLSVMLTL